MDKGIIHLLQKDARNNTTTDIAEVIDVSEIIKQHRTRPFDRFGSDSIDDS